MKRREPNYKLYPDELCVRLELNNGTSTDYFDCNKEFLRILDQWQVTPFNNGGRLQADFKSAPDETPIRMYMYDLALCCYQGTVHAETLSEDLQKYFNWKNTQGLTVDHLDGNPHNNTRLNLALMSGSNNSSKQSFPAGFVAPYDLTTAYVDGEFRVQLFMRNTELDVLQELLNRVRPGAFHLNDGAGISTLRFVCEDSDSFVKCLGCLYDARFDWCNPEGTARTNKRVHKDAAYLTTDVKQSIFAQNALALLDRSQFQLFTGENIS